MDVWISNLSNEIKRITFPIYYSSCLLFAGLPLTFCERNIVAIFLVLIVKAKCMKTVLKRCL